MRFCRKSNTPQTFSPAKGQTAIEYLLLLGAVAVVVLLGFNSFIPESQKQLDNFFLKASQEIYGNSTMEIVNGTKGRARSADVNYP